MSNANLYFYFSFIIFLLLLMIMLILHDYKQHKQTEGLEKLKKEIENKAAEIENGFEIIFEHSRQSIAIVNLNGNIIRANKAFCELLNYLESDIPLINYFNLLNPYDINLLQISIRYLLDNKTGLHQSEHECFKKNGEKIWILSSISLLRNEDGTPKHFIIQLENITLQKNAKDRLQHMAYHDPLTGLANRNKLEQMINHLLAAANRRPESFALLYLDLDGFKNINDTLGHDTGDMLLQIVAERLRNSVRVTDAVARLGGDEFVVLITDVKNTEAVAVIAKKILENVLQAIILKGHDLYITTSIGISIYPNDGENLPMLMKSADLALYRAKEHGRNNYQFYTQEMTLKANEKMNIKNALEQAVAKNELYILYQPKMEISTQRITGVEALLRWNNVHFKDIKPDEIIALAEEFGLIISLSEWIVKTACDQLKTWHAQGFTSLTMAINCTTRQFKQSMFIEDLNTLIQKMDFEPKYLEIEITEKMIMKDPDNMLRILDALKASGLQIVIDDFGTGYWSIGNLRKLQVDKIKIDTTYTKKIMVDKTSSEITSAIIAMVNKLGVTSVAEGVETREQYEFLAKEGCQEIQGYYLSRPLSEKAMTAFLKQPIILKEEVSETLA